MIVTVSGKVRKLTSHTSCYLLLISRSFRFKIIDVEEFDVS